MNVSYIDDALMTTLNKQHRHKDSSTDILSFPAHTVGGGCLSAHSQKVDQPGHIHCTKRTVDENERS